MDFVIAIPTKGRPKEQTAYDLLVPFYKDVYLFVEPQDYDAYAEQGYPNLINIGANDMGVAFVRNRILEYFPDVPYIIQSDDDIVAFYKRNENWKYEQYYIISEVIEAVLEVLPYAGYVGMPCAEVAWRAPRCRYSWGKKTYSFAALNNKAIQKMGICYDEKVRLFEDIDFQLQMMIRGVETCAVNGYSFKGWSGEIRKKDKANRTDGCFGDWNDVKAVRCSCYIRDKYGEKYIKLREDSEGRMNYTVDWKQLLADGKKWRESTK